MFAGGTWWESGTAAAWMGQTVGLSGKPGASAKIIIWESGFVRDHLQDLSVWQAWWAQLATWLS